MKFLNDVWGINENISPLEAAARAAVMFLITLILIRLYGMKPFEKGNTFDTIITFFIGGILVRGVIGATPFFSTIAAAIAILAVHKIMALTSFYSKGFGWLVKGKNILLFKDGVFMEKNMRKTCITKHDIFEKLRTEMKVNSIDNIKEIYIERTGSISFIKKPELNEF